MDERPEASECHEYYRRYIDQVPDGDVVDTLGREMGVTTALLRSVPAELEAYRYAPGKWSVREVVGHLIDSERVFGMRALHIARRDPAPLPSMEQDAWVSASDATRRPLHDLVAELEAVRRGHVLLFGGLDEEVLGRRGVASGREFTVRALIWIIAGHELHHRSVLEERYLDGRAAKGGPR